MFVARSLAARALPRLAVLTALVGALGLVACGGNVSRSEPYVPDKLVSFGDEHSAFTSDGHKYSVNGLTTTNGVAAFDCNVNPTWSQYVAQGYGFVYPQCNPGNVATKAETRAVPGAKIDDVVNQVNAYGAFTSTTLVTLMVGTHDVLDAYAAVKSNAMTAPDALALMKSQGTKLGQLVNQIANAGNGGRVLFALVPDVGYSPYAAAEELAVPGRAQFIRDLVDALNSAARLAVIDNGRWSALMTANETVASMYKFPASYAIGDVVTAGCLLSAPLPNCDSTTLVDTTVNYLWADNQHMGATAHSQIGSVALLRARNNPF